MRTWCALLVIMLAFAGCTTDAEPDVDTHSEVDGQEGEPDGAVDEPEVANVAPAASLEADASEGEAPLRVNFTITVTDEDGDALEWTLDFGDGQDARGTTSTTLDHTYEAGNFTAVLTVSDGALEVNATVEITSTEGGSSPAPGPGPEPEPQPEPEEPETAYCEPEGFEDHGGIYTDGAWIFAETNGVPGLQVENNHPTGAAPFTNDEWEGCAGGDQMLV